LFSRVVEAEDEMGREAARKEENESKRVERISLQNSSERESMLRWLTRRSERRAG